MMSSSTQGSKDIILPVTIEEYFRSHRFDELKRYLDITEKYLKKAKDDFEVHLDEQWKKISNSNLDPKDINELNDFYNEEYWLYSEIFPRILRNSFFVAIHSLLEYKMGLVCKRINEERKIPISWSDLRGDTPKQFKLYCKLAHLEFPFSNPAWQQIKYYSKVRNCIVHTDGLLAEFQCKDKRGFITYLTGEGIISQKQEIALTPNFCENVVKTMRVFLNKVIEVYDSQKKWEVKY